MTLTGINKSQAEQLKPHLKTGLASSMGVESADVVIKNFEDVARRLNEERRLAAGVKINYEITVEDEAAATKLVSKVETTKNDSTAFLTALKAAVAADPDLQELKAAMEAVTVEFSVATIAVPLASKPTTTAQNSDVTDSGCGRFGTELAFAAVALVTVLTWPVTV